MNPVPFCSFGGYRLFSTYWWKDLGRYLYKGWWRDIRTYWYRARYGWAPKDTWGLDHYLATVMAGSLKHLADHTRGTPICYPEQNPTGADCQTNHEQWVADLKRWASVFEVYARQSEDLFKALPTKPTRDDYSAINDEEQRRYKAVQAALAELTPWFGGLWD